MKPVLKYCVLVGTTAAMAACSTNPPPMVAVDADWEEVGEASWYGPGFHGNRTASGEVYDMEALTAAHKRLPFGARVRVFNMDNGRETQVRINDRGPFARGRIIDLSRAAARDIGMLGSGTARVRISVLEQTTAARPRARRGPVDIPEGCQLVQVGAYREAGNAAEMARRLRARGESVRQVQAPNGVTRVLVGPFESRAETRLTLERFDGLLRSCDS
ncbi:MAG: septal ring lytic transglycosylase RlpA family protein [Gemmatimonadota bacterium]